MSPIIGAEVDASPEAGGTVATSPLAGLITSGMLTAAKVGGAGAVGGHLG